MNNLLSYCGLVDARIRASKKDLPVQRIDEGNALIMDLEDTLADVSASTSEDGRKTLEVELKQISQMWTKHLKQIQGNRD